MDIITLSGNCGKDPKVHYTEKGNAITWFQLAVNKRYGEDKKTIWFPVQARYKLAESIGNNLCKGRKILIRGSIEIGTNQQGEDFMYIRVRELEYLDKKKAVA